MCDTVKNQLEKDTKFQKMLFKNPAWRMTSFFMYDSSKFSASKEELNCLNSNSESVKIYSNEWRVSNQNFHLISRNWIHNEFQEDCGKIDKSLNDANKLINKILINSRIYSNQSMSRLYFSFILLNIK